MAKRVYEICYSNSITINRGNYENEKPFYSQKVVIESDEEIDTVAEYNKLREIIDPMAQARFKEGKVSEAGLRVREKDGKKYPSVTSILNPAPYTGNPEYGVRGTEVHRIINHYAVTGEWDEPKEPLKTLRYEDVKYREFFLSFGDRIDYSDQKQEVTIFNDDYLYSGEVDVICNVDGIKTLGDYKTGSWKWAQLVAYWKAMNDKSIKQLAVFDLKKQKLEILKLTSDDARSAWESFLVLRGKFQGIYGI